jgi:hypothetical protein
MQHFLAGANQGSTNLGCQLVHSTIFRRSSPNARGSSCVQHRDYPWEEHSRCTHFGKYSTASRLMMRQDVAPQMKFEVQTNTQTILRQNVNKLNNKQTPAQKLN